MSTSPDDCAPFLEALCRIGERAGWPVPAFVAEHACFGGWPRLGLHDLVLECARLGLVRAWLGETLMLCPTAEGLALARRKRAPPRASAGCCLPGAPFAERRRREPVGLRPEVLPMVRQCAWCGLLLGQCEPLDGAGVTHGICPACWSRLEGEWHAPQDAPGPHGQLHDAGLELIPSGEED
jgi:hypothetical protein